MAKPIPNSFEWTASGEASWQTPGNWFDVTTNTAALRAPTAGDAVTITATAPGAAVTIDGPGRASALTLGGAVTLAGDVRVNSVILGELVPSGAFDFFTPATLDVASGHVQTNALTMSASTITVGAAASLEVGAAGHATQGAVTVDANARLSGSGFIDALIDNGTVIADGGYLAVDTISGSGMLQIAAGSVLTVFDSFTNAVRFTGSNAHLQLDAFSSNGTLSPVGVISHFGVGDFIDLGLAAEPVSLAYTRTGSDIGLLTVGDASDRQQSFSIIGDYSDAVFFLSGTTIGVANKYVGEQPVSVGTAVANTYVWAGVGSGNWNSAANWTDTTTGTGAAAVAPGSRDDVTITGSAGQLFDYISGHGHAASLTIINNVGLVGNYRVDTLGVGKPAAGGLPFPTFGSLELSLGLLVANAGDFYGVGASYLDQAQLRVFGRLGVAGPILLSDHSSAHAGALVLAQGGINIDVTSSMEVGNGKTVALGAFSVDAGATVSSSGESSIGASVIDDGTITVDSGSLFMGAVSGQGQIVIETGATLADDGSSTNVVFAGTNATLDVNIFLGTPSAVQPILDFGTTDVIDLQDFGFSGANFQQTQTAAGTNVDVGSGVLESHFTFSAAAVPDHFAIKTDGSNGTLLYLA